MRSQAAGALLLAFSVAAAAADPAPAHWHFGCAGQDRHADAEAQNQRGVDSLRLLYENDMFSAHRLLYKDGGSDRWYTDGIKAVAMLCPVKARDDTLSKALAWFLPEGDRQFGYTFGQLMFTPENVSLTTPQPNDRFWAGYLFVGAVAQVNHAASVDSLELDLGVIGPPALGEEAQTLIHKIRGFDLPNGWGNQMKTEPTLNLHYLSMYRGLPRFALGKNLNFDATPHYGGAAGTVYDYANAGVTFRIGDDLSPAPAGTIEIPSLGGVRRLDHRWDLFVRFDLRASVHNAFVDSGLLRGEPHPTNVKGKPFTYQINRGLTFENKGWRATLMFNRRSREFNNVPGTRSVHSFGTINLEYQFPLR